jgi:hypothetical protein
VRSDNDLKIFVLARAHGRRGAEVVVESLCGFDPSTDGRQGQADLSTNTENAGLSELPVSTYHIAD